MTNRKRSLVMSIFCALLANPWYYSTAEESSNTTAPTSQNLVTVEFKPTAGQSVPAGLQITGDAEWRAVGNSSREYDGAGVRLLSGQDLNQDDQHEGLYSRQSVSFLLQMDVGFAFAFVDLLRTAFKWIAMICSWKWSSFEMVAQTRWTMCDSPSINKWNAIAPI